MPAGIGAWSGSRSQNGNSRLTLLGYLVDNLIAMLAKLSIFDIAR
jgi:hypothetical protein